MAVFRAPALKYQGFSDTGTLLTGGLLYAYAAGTVDLEDTFTSNTGLTANTNPIVLNARGEPPFEIWLSEGVAYKFTLKTAAGVSLWTEDNIRGINDATITLDEWVASGFTPSYVNATSFTVAGDHTADFQVYRRVRTTNTGGTRYGTISSSSFGAGVTTVVLALDSGSLDSGLSAVDLSFLGSTNTSVPSRGTTLYIGDTANSMMTLGQTINQGGADNEIQAFKSSDVAHATTNEAEADTYAAFKKLSAAQGGLELSAYRSAGTSTFDVRAFAFADDTSKDNNSVAPIMLSPRKQSGAGGTVVGANGNILVVRNETTTRFILDADGDSHQDVGTAWTNFDSYDDVALLNAASALLGPDTLRGSFTAGFLMENRKRLEELRIVTFNEDGRPFINWSRFHMLHMGATRWLADQLQAATQKIDQLLKLIESQ